MARLLRPEAVARTVQAALKRKQIRIPPLTLWVIVTHVYDVLGLRPAILSQAVLDEHMNYRLGWWGHNRRDRFDRACRRVRQGLVKRENNARRPAYTPVLREPKRARRLQATKVPKLTAVRNDLAVIQMLKGVTRRDAAKGAALQKGLTLMLVGRRPQPVRISHTDLTALLDLSLDWYQKGYAAEAAFVDNLWRLCVKAVDSGDLTGLDLSSNPL